MIEDAELRKLFEAESIERIQHLKECFRELEQRFDQDMLDGVFRDAHSIKGAARMLSLYEIENKAHQLEEILESAKKQQIVLSSHDFDLLNDLLSEIEQLVAKEIYPSEQIQQQESSNTQIPHKQQIPSENTLQTPPKTSPQTSPQELKDKQANLVLHFATHSLPTTTIRVQSEQIHELMNQAGDLTVTKNRLFNFVEQVDNTLSLVEKSIHNRPGLQYFQKSETTQEMDIESLLQEVQRQLTKIRNSAYEDFHKLDQVTTSLAQRIRHLGRVPLSKLFDLFPHMMKEISQTCHKEIDFVMEGGEITVDKKIIEDMKDPLMHLLRNAVVHGIELPEERVSLGKPRQGRILLKAQQIAHTILIEINDNGKGLDLEKIKQKAVEEKLVKPEDAERLEPAQLYSFIFRSGFSTASSATELAGRGVGMDVVKSHIEQLGGTIFIESQPGHECRFSIELPTTALTTHVFLIEVVKKIYAIPIEVIESVQLLSINQIFQIDQQDTLMVKDQPIPIRFMPDLLNIPTQYKTLQLNSLLPCLILNVGDKKLAIIVENILDEQQVVVMPFPDLLIHIPYLTGATILKTGQVCLVINAFNLIKASHALSSINIAHLKQDLHLKSNKKYILIVDDSQSVRAYYTHFLEEEGYEVLTAQDGLEALHQLKDIPIDAIVSDIQMPNMDGLTLVAYIRRDEKYRHLPFIFISSLNTKEDQQKGLKAGANAYLIKSPTVLQDLLYTLNTFLLM